MPTNDRKKKAIDERGSCVEVPLVNTLLHERTTRVQRVETTTFAGLHVFVQFSAENTFGGGAGGSRGVEFTFEQKAHSTLENISPVRGRPDIASLDPTLRGNSFALILM